MAVAKAGSPLTASYRTARRLVLISLTRNHVRASPYSCCWAWDVQPREL
ncbi:hypothetical protein [Nonomuraea sp. NPDC049684]